MMITKAFFTGFKIRNGFNFGLLDVEGLHEPFTVDGKSMDFNGFVFRILCFEIALGFIYMQVEDDKDVQE